MNLHSHPKSQTAPIKDQEIRDLIKTIQIQLCMKQSEMSSV